MAAARSPVRYERHGAVALLTLDQPPVNVLSQKVLESLLERLDQAESDLEARAVVLASAAEKAFAAGADIAEMAPLSPEEARLHSRRGQAVTRRIELLPLPVIAAVHGVCLGGGCEVALACDLVVASDDARFGQPEIQLGVMPGWGGTQRLPRRIGASRARRWIYLGSPVSAADAQRDGWVDQVVPRAHLLETALGLAAELATRSPVALAAAKYAILAAIDRGIDEGLSYELDLWAHLFSTQDQKDGMRAFLEKRTFRPAGRQQWERDSQWFPWESGGTPKTETRPSGKPKKAAASTGT